jgi:carbamoyltransferase
MGHKGRKLRLRYPCIVHSHATTWHDGNVAMLLKDGRIVALAAERVGDRYKHSWNSKLAYEHLRNLFAEDNTICDFDSATNHFVDPVNGLQTTGHHLYHAATAYFGSPFSKAAILVIDGQGPEFDKRASTTIWKGEKGELTLIEAPYLTDGIFAPQSIGHFYTAVGALAGMKNLFEEGKTMGLAPYGRPSKFLEFFRQYAYSNTDGSYYIDPRFVYAVFGNTLGSELYGWSPQPMAIQEIWEDFIRLRGKPLRSIDDDVNQEDMDTAYAGQVILEEIVLGLAKRARNLTSSKYLCLAGGVALNSMANGKILQSGVFKDLFIFPAAGDDGQAIGKLFYEIQSTGIPISTKTKTAYYGPVYSRERILRAVAKYSERVRIVENIIDYIEWVTDKIIEGKVVGWFQGGSELGPRALGHRSILADPRMKDMRNHINFHVKFREWYRPLAPVVTEEDASYFFEIDRSSPFMLIIANVRAEKRELLPAVTHIDGSARVQTINERQDRIFYALVKRFGEKTGIPVLLNTSFNRRGEPIVETPEDALEAFLNMNLDMLIMEDLIIEAV